MEMKLYIYILVCQKIAGDYFFQINALKIFNAVNAGEVGGWLGLANM